MKSKTERRWIIVRLLLATTVGQSFILLAMLYLKVDIAPFNVFFSAIAMMTSAIVVGNYVTKPNEEA